MQELLESLLEQGIEPQQAELMAKYGQLVAQANEKFNLTRILSPADMAKSHFIDSVDAARRGYIDTHAKIIDIGTGAGFPGVPLAIFFAAGTGNSHGFLRKKDGVYSRKLCSIAD